MDRLISQRRNAAARHHRVRQQVSGGPKRPRLSVYISNRYVTAQLIDDQNGQTLVYVSTTANKTAGQNLTEQASWVGSQIAKQANSKKIKQVVFDRGGRRYHGRIKALATAAREAGLEF